MAVRILFVLNSADLYGASRSLLRMLPWLQQHGTEPMILLPEEGPLRERVEALGVKVFIDPGLSVIDRATFKSWRIIGFVLGFPLSVGKLFRLIVHEQASLVHTNTGVMPSAALAAKLAGRPHVWHIRDSFQEFRSLWSIYRRYISALSNRIICVSNPIAEQFAKTDPVTVIHDVLPLEEFPAKSETLRIAFREKHRLGNTLVVGCVGRIKFVRKGQEVLVQAAALLKQRGVAVKYLIVGAPFPGNEEHLIRLERLIDDLNLRAEVLLTGELADPKPAYAAMDVFVLPSAQPEPFGGVVMEAMAMRLPVIATAIGGSLDQVADGTTGFLVPPGNAEALANKLELLLRDWGLRQQMGEAGRQRLEKCFSATQLMEKIEDVYRELTRPSQTGSRS